MVSLGQFLISSTDPLMKAVTKQHRDTLSQNISIMKMANNYGRDIIEDPPEAYNKTTADSSKEKFMVPKTNRRAT